MESIFLMGPSEYYKQTRLSIMCDNAYQRDTSFHSIPLDSPTKIFNNKSTLFLPNAISLHGKCILFLKCLEYQHHCINDFWLLLFTWATNKVFFLQHYVGHILFMQVIRTHNFVNIKSFEFSYRKLIHLSFVLTRFGLEFIHTEYNQLVW